MFKEEFLVVEKNTFSSCMISYRAQRSVEKVTEFFVQNWILSNLKSMSTSFNRETSLLILNQQEGLIEQVNLSPQFQPEFVR